MIVHHFLLNARCFIVALAVSFVMKLVLDILMVFAPVLGYIPQYKMIANTKDTEGFSTMVCLILLISNLLRLFFWLGKQFEVVLVYQSIVMIIAQMLLLELIVRIRGTQAGRAKVRHLTHVQYFWKWEYFGEYLIFLTVFSVVMAVITAMNFFLESIIITEGIGFLALLIEACIGIPQIINNYKNKSTEGLSFFLILSWFAGDTFKTFYFLSEEAPAQFIMCGILQLIADCIILGQMFIYSRSESKQVKYARAERANSQ